MAIMETTRGRTSDFGDWLRSAWSEFREDLERRRVYNETYAQLNALSDRDLSDIGVSRLQIGDIARDAVHRR